MVQRTLYRTLAVGAIALLSVCLYAEDRHYIRVSADFSYARDVARGKKTSAEGTMNLSSARAIIGSGMMEPGVSGNGFAPGLGVGYRLYYNHFLLDAGIGAEYRQTYLQPSDLTNVYERGVDEQGFAYMGHHQWTSRACQLRHAGINLPVMAGGEWNNFYVLAGVKLQMDIWGHSTEQGKYSLEGAYERYMDPFSGMANHGFVTDEPYRCEPVPMQTTFGMRACVEAGYCIYGAEESGRYNRNRPKIKCYAGAFAEYGVVGSKETYSPLLAGVRLTMLIALPEAKKCTCWRF